MYTSNPAAASSQDEHRPPFYRRQGLRRALLLIVSVPILAMIWYYVPSLKDLSIASWHRRCASYKAPAGQVVYDDDPATYAQRLGGADYVGNVLRQDRPYAVRDNPEWQGLSRDRYGIRVMPVAFLGARTSPGGNRRLVAVQFGTVQPDANWNRFVFSSCLETTNVTGLRTTNVGSPDAPPLVLFRQSGDNLRVFDGRPDPGDASRFTIDVQINGTTHTVDGQLHDNDTITLAPRASAHVLHMGSAFWNPTGVSMFDWLAKAPGATTVSGSPASAADHE